MGQRIAAWVALALVLVSAWGCSPSGHAHLIGGIPSRVSVDEALAFLQIKEGSWVVEDEERRSSSLTKTPYHLVQIKVEGYRHLDVVGELRLRFLDGKLQATFFAPDAFEEYRRRLERDRGFTFAPHYRTASARIAERPDWWDVRLPGASRLEIVAEDALAGERRYFVWYDAALMRRSARLRTES